MRVGVGYDVHALVSGRRLVLGGVVIPWARGLAGHSDGDVVIHAVCDALLGAAGLGDLGHHFPSTDARWKDAESRLFLATVRDWLRERGLAVENIDATIVAEAPRLDAHAAAMAAAIADVLDLDVTRVSIKATTTDGLGFAGRGEGISCYAVALLR